MVFFLNLEIDKYVFCVWIFLVSFFVGRVIFLIEKFFRVISGVGESFTILRFYVLDF